VRQIPPSQQTSHTGGHLRNEPHPETDGSTLEKEVGVLPAIPQSRLHAFSIHLGFLGLSLFEFHCNSLFVGIFL
jgi:hypothetical protein